MHHLRHNYLCVTSLLKTSKNPLLSVEESINQSLSLKWSVPCDLDSSPSGLLHNLIGIPLIRRHCLHSESALRYLYLCPSPHVLPSWGKQPPPPPAGRASMPFPVSAIVCNLFCSLTFRCYVYISPSQPSTFSHYLWSFNSTMNLRRELMDY